MLGLEQASRIVPRGALGWAKRRTWYRRVQLDAACCCSDPIPACPPVDPMAGIIVSAAV